jgi:hypothetical protein
LSKWPPTLKKRTYINHQRWTSLWRSFAPSLVPRPAVLSPQSYSLQSTVHHPSSSSVIYSSKVHTIHHPPRPYSLQPTVCYPPHTIHHPSQSTVLFSPAPFTVRHPPSPRPSTVHHPPHPSHPNRITALPNGRPTSASWRQPGCSPVLR